MEKVVLLEQVNRKQMMVFAGIMGIQGVFLIYRNDLEIISLLIGGGLIIGCIFYLIYAFLGFSAKSKYAAGISVSDTEIKLKSSFWKPAVSINWSEVKLIHFASYKIEFELTTGTLAFPYNTSSQKSIELKRIVRAFGEPKNIPVISG